jgi:hypothetical protein
MAIIRLLVSPIDPSKRKLVFLYRVCVCVFAIALSVPTQAIMFHVGLSLFWGSLVEMVIAIAIGEHLIFNDLQRRGILPEHAVRLPLSV